MVAQVGRGVRKIAGDSVNTGRGWFDFGLASAVVCGDIGSFVLSTSAVVGGSLSRSMSGVAGVVPVG